MEPAFQVGGKERGREVGGGSSGPRQLLSCGPGDCLVFSERLGDQVGAPSPCVHAGWTPPAQAVPRRANAPRGSAGLEERLVTMEQTFRTDMEAIKVMTTVFSSIFEYSDDNATSTTDPAFKSSLTQLYSQEKRGGSAVLLFCMATQCFLPKPFVIASHIFKRQWHKTAKTLQDFEIHDPCNGLLLFKPFEWAFDTSRMIILVEDEHETDFQLVGDTGLRKATGDQHTYTMVFLDPSLKDVPVKAKFYELWSSKGESVRATVAQGFLTPSCSRIVRALT